eukprot:scaffold4409_cov369-Prasinococcus_capsulatus_cf.AAC.21
MQVPPPKHLRRGRHQQMTRSAQTLCLWEKLKREGPMEQAAVRRSGTSMPYWRCSGEATCPWARRIRAILVGDDSGTVAARETYAHCVLVDGEHIVLLTPGSWSTPAQRPPLRSLELCNGICTRIVLLHIFSILQQCLL